MRILICDDDKFYADELDLYIKEFMQHRHICFEIDECCSPEEVIKSNASYDLAFLDIQMGKTDGITLAKELKLRNEKTVIFFVTSYGEYLDDACDLRAFRFFEKPVQKARLEKSLEKALEFLDETYVDFFVSVNNKQIKIPVNDVIFIERSNRKIKLVTVNNTYYTRETLDEWRAKLPNTFFQTVHNSYIVNLHFVTEYNYSYLTVEGKTEIPIASRKQTEFRKVWFDYLRRR